jgi:hypothetical protein
MRPVLVVLGLLLLFPFSTALQAIDAENAVAQGNYLEPNEKAAVFKALPQMNGSQKYWVVSVIQNDTLRTLIVIADKDGKLVEKSVLRTNLFSANLLVQRLSTLKTQTSWLVSLLTTSKLEELANAVENEEFDVDIVSETVTTPSLKSDIGVLKGKLDTMASELREIANGIKELSDYETQFLNVSIDTGLVNGVASRYADVYTDIDSVKEEAAEYDQEISKVKNQIASDDSLDTQTKSQLLGLLSPLGPNQTLTSAISPYSDLAAENKQRVSVEAASLPTKTNALGAEADARSLRVSAYQTIYLLDENLKKTAGFDTLLQGAQIILAEENKSRWVDQVDVINLEGAWENTQTAFQKKQYANAKELADKSKALVKKIKTQGIEESVDPAQQVSDAIITGLAYILGGIAIILIGKKAMEMIKARNAEE